MEDPLFEAQMMRALGYAPYGGADVGEVLATAAQIRATDLSLWLREWTALAMRVYAEAERSHAAGDRVGACRGYLSASNYFRTSWLFELRPPVSELLSWGHLREVDAFRRGAALLPTPPRLVQIPYDGTTLPGYFFAVDDRPRRTLILTNGYDGTGELGRGPHVHHDLELEQVRARGDRLGTLTGVRVDRGTVAPGSEGLLVLPLGDHEVAVLALDRAQQLEAQEARRPVDGVGAVREPLLQLLVGLLGHGDGVDLHD